LLNSNQNFIETLSDNLVNIKEKVHFCNECNSLTDMNKEKCNICESLTRDKSTIAIVEEYLDMVTIEESG